MPVIRNLKNIVYNLLVVSIVPKQNVQHVPWSWVLSDLTELLPLVISICEKGFTIHCSICDMAITICELLPTITTKVTQCVCVCVIMITFRQTKLTNGHD